MPQLIPDERSLVLYWERIVFHCQNAAGYYLGPEVTPRPDGASFSAWDIWLILSSLDVMIFFQLCSSREPLIRGLPTLPVRIQQQISKPGDERQGRVHHQLRGRVGGREAGPRRRFRARGEAGAEAAAEGASERGGPRRDDGSHVAGIER